MVGILIGRVVGNKVVFRKNEFGEYEIAKRLEKVELEVYYDPVTGVVEAIADGKTVATSDTPGGLQTQLYKVDIEVPQYEMSKLPKIGTIWIPEEVEEKKRYLERFSKEGTRVVTEDPNEVITRTIFKISDNEYEEVEFRYHKGDDSAEVTKTKYYIINNNGKETIRLIWTHQFVNLF